MKNPQQNLKNFDKLSAIVEMLYQQDVFAYSQDLIAIRLLEDEISTVRIQVAKHAENLSPSEMVQWQKHRGWLSMRLRRLNIELAKSYADSEILRNNLSESAGKRSVISKLARR